MESLHMFLNAVSTCVIAGTASFLTSLAIEDYLTERLGIPDERETPEDLTLNKVFGKTLNTVFFLNMVICVGLQSVFGGLMVWGATAVLMTFLFWWFAIKKIFPKLSFFTPRFKRAMEGEFVQVKK